MENLTVRIPVLINSPSYHYLWVECFFRVYPGLVGAFGGVDGVEVGGGVEGDEDVPSKEFSSKLTRAYEGYVSMRHPRDLTFFLVSFTFFL